VEANAATALAASAGLALGVAPLVMGVVPFSWRKVRRNAQFRFFFLLAGGFSKRFYRYFIRTWGMVSNPRMA